MVSPSVGKMLRLLCACTKKISDATAITISGTTRVRYTSTSKGTRQRFFIRASESAAAVPSTVAISDARNAIQKLVLTAGT